MESGLDPTLRAPLMKVTPDKGPLYKETHQLGKETNRAACGKLQWMVSASVIKIREVLRNQRGKHFYKEILLNNFHIQ